MHIYIHIVGDLGAIARTSAAVSGSPPGRTSTIRVLQDADVC